MDFPASLSVYRASQERYGEVFALIWRESCPARGEVAEVHVLGPAQADRPWSVSVGFGKAGLLTGEEGLGVFDPDRHAVEWAEVGIEMDLLAWIDRCKPERWPAPLKLSPVAPSELARIWRSGRHATEIRSIAGSSAFKGLREYLGWLVTLPLATHTPLS